MRLLKLTQGKFAQVDDDVYDYLNRWKWYAHKCKNTFYTVRNWINPEGIHGLQYMHHLVIGIIRLPKELGLNADHKDGNGLNNTRGNLKIMNHRKNQQNLKVHRKGNLVGVHLDSNPQRKTKRWKAQIKLEGKYKFLGYFKTEQEAHERYMQELKIRGLV